MGVSEKDDNGVRILVAEDNRDDRWFLEQAFGKAAPGISLNFVQNGQEVLDYLQGQKPFTNREIYPLPAFLILALTMPLMDGFEVIGWVRKQYELSSLPIVVLSSSSDWNDIERARALGA